MRPRFQADCDLKESIRSGTIQREPTIEFRGAREAALAGLSDFDVLRLAAAEGRIVVSYDETKPLAGAPASSRANPGYAANASCSRSACRMRSSLTRIPVDVIPHVRAISSAE